MSETTQQEFSKLNGYAVKDAQARADIEDINLELYGDDPEAVNGGLIGRVNVLQNEVGTALDQTLLHEEKIEALEEANTAKEERIVALENANLKVTYENESLTLSL